MKVHTPSQVALRFIHANKEQLQEAARSMEWIRTHLVPLMASEGLDWKAEHWYLSVSREQFECQEPGDPIDEHAEDII